MVAPELQERLKRMSQSELSEIMAYADQLRVEARVHEIGFGLEEILDQWKQLLACVSRIQRKSGIEDEDIWLSIRDWTAPGPEGEEHILPLGKLADSHDYSFAMVCRDEGQSIERGVC